MTDTSTVVFIVGTGHCGSTLLDMLLGAHPAGFGLGEIEKLAIHTLNDKICTCGVVLRDCPFWGALITQEAETIATGLRYVHQPTLDTILHKKHYYFATKSGKRDTHFTLDAYTHFFQSIHAYVLRKKASKFVIDSSKNILRAAVLSEHTEMQPVIIHVLRDPRGVVNSYRRKYGKPGRYMYRWIVDNIKISITARSTRALHLPVWYEDLATAPEATLERILTAIGQEYDPAMLQFRNVEQHQVGGNRLRYQSEANIKLDEKWRTELPRPLQLVTLLTTGWLLFYYLFRYKRHVRS